MTFLKSTIVLPDSTIKKRASSALTLAGWLAVILLETWLLLNDVVLFRESGVPDFDASSGDAIGRLHEKQNTVRVQNSGDLVWYEGRRGQRLHEGQMLLTLARSRADLVFDRGQTLSLESNSLVQIQGQPDDGGQHGPEAALLLLRGTLRGRTERPVTVVTGQFRAEAQPGSEFKLTASENPDTESRFEVTRGEVKVTSPRGVTSVMGGEQVSMRPLDPDSIRKTKTLPIELLSPSAGESHEAESPRQTEMPVDLRWRVQGGSKAPDEKFVIEWSRDPKLARIDGTQTVSETSARLGLPVTAESETWYWRVRSSDGQFESSVGYFEIEPAAALFEQTTPAPTATPEPTAVPTPAPTPAPRKRGAPPPPKRLLPPQFKKQTRAPAGESRGTRSWWDFWIPSAAADELPVAGWEVRLKWEPAPGARGYVVQVGRTRDFSSIVGEGRPTQPEWIWLYRPGMENTRGRVFYRVASVGEDGQVGKFSPPQPIQIPREQKVTVAATPSPRPLPPLVEADAWQEWRFGLTGGVSSIRQATEARTLRSVLVNTPFLAGGAIMGVELRSPDRHLELALQTEWASYRSAGANSPAQAKHSAWSMQAKAFRWSLQKKWNGAWGAVVDRSYRWVKSSHQAVSADGTFALGPLLGGRRRWRETSGIQPAEIGASLALPLTGILTGGQLGAAVELWSAWSLSRRFTAFARAEAGHLLWDDPDPTQVTRYSVSAGLVYRFASSRWAGSPP